MTLSPQHDPMGQAVLDYLQNGQAEAIAVHSTIFDDDEIPVSHLFSMWVPEPDAMLLPFKPKGTKWCLLM